MNNIIKRTIGFLGVALMASQLFGKVTTANRDQRPSSSAFEQAAPVTEAQKDASSLMKEISASAAIVERRADTLDSFARGRQVSHTTHASELMGVKDAINTMGVDFRKLQELRPFALPWQQAAIDRLEPVLLGMAGEATAAIELLSPRDGKHQSAQYRQAIGNLYAYAGHARTVIAVNLDYSQAREKLNRLDAASDESISEASAPAKAAISLEQRVRSELLKLPYYGVFDYLAFQIDGDQVILSGHVNWPALKTDAERAVRGVEGVTAVNSTIEVLPLSPNDDRIRIAAYRAIYGHAALVRYRLNPQPPIRIIVKNGNVTLMGVVGSDMDRNVANLQANGVPGVFSVTNNLEVDG